jgi:hypothetical protein
MTDISEVKRRLDEINAAVSSYDPVLKEHARDILLREAFGSLAAKPGALAEKAPPAGVERNATDDNAQVPFNVLIEKWTPTAQADWALLGAYYFQRILGHQNVTGYQVNKELKQHGYPASNITDSFTVNMESEPARILQTKKAGKSRQGKKQYLVTTAGIKYVEDRLSGNQQG